MKLFFVNKKVEIRFFQHNIELWVGKYEGNNTKYEQNVIKQTVNVCEIMKASSFLGRMISNSYKNSGTSLTCPIKIVRLLIECSRFIS